MSSEALVELVRRGAPLDTGEHFGEEEEAAEGLEGDPA
jgi:hypothetical protein